MISIYQFSQIEGIVFPFFFPLPYSWKLSPLFICMVVKSGRTPLALEALPLLALPLLFTLAKFEEETTSLNQYQYLCPASLSATIASGFNLNNDNWDLSIV